MFIAQLNDMTQNLCREVVLSQSICPLPQFLKVKPPNAMYFRHSIDRRHKPDFFLCLKLDHEMVDELRAKGRP